MTPRKIAAFVACACLFLGACGSRVAPLPGTQLANGQLGTTGGGTGQVPGASGVPTPGATTGRGGIVEPPSSILKPGCKGGATDQGVTSSTLKLGLIASLTGPLPGQFDSEVEAVDSYFRAINDAGGICGRKIILEIRDDNGNGTTNLNLASKMATEDHIFAFVGSVSAPDDSGIATVAADVNHKYGGPYPDLGFPLTWKRTESPTNFSVPGAVQHDVTGEGASGTKWLNQQFGIKQVAIFWLRESEVSVLSAWGFEAADIKAKLSSDGKSSGVTICHEQPAGVLDSYYGNYVSSMLADCDPANGPIAIYTTMENNANIKLANALQQGSVTLCKKVGQKDCMVFAPTFSSYLPSFITGARAHATEGAFIAMPQIPFERLSQPQSSWTPGTYELQRYYSTLLRYYPRPHPPGSFGAPGWGSADLFAQAAAKCGAALTRSCVLNNLRTWPPYTDSGFLSPNKPGDHTIYHADLLVQVQNGQFTEVNPQLKSGPSGAPDFWDDSKLFDWGIFWWCHQDLFPQSANADKHKLVYAGRKYQVTAAQCAASNHQT
ncbi:MAG: ABC transporter substrate-binding protein [Actinobacteria bacterium]|nr:ABC transporter substrate-binding protein [Actinomycetota bacterium]